MVRHRTLTPRFVGSIPTSPVLIKYRKETEMKREIINLKTNEITCVESNSAYFALVEFAQHMDNLAKTKKDICFSSNNRYMILEYGQDVFVCKLERRVSYNIR